MTKNNEMAVAQTAELTEHHKKISALAIVEDWEWLQESSSSVSRPYATESPERNSSFFEHFAEAGSLLTAMMRGAGFTGSAIHFAEVVIKIVSSNPELQPISDFQFARIAGVTTRTIRSWRKTLKSENGKFNFDFIEIIEADFNRETGKFGLSKYRIPTNVISVLNDATARLLNIENYQLNRQFNIEATAKIFLNDILPQRIIKPRAKKRKGQIDPLRSKLNGLISEIKKSHERGNLQNTDSRYFAEISELAQELDATFTRCNLLTPKGAEIFSYGDRTEL